MLNRVSIVNPGFVETPMARQYGLDPNKIWATTADQIPDEEDKQIVLKMLTADPEIVVGTEMQTTDDISKLFQEVILTPKPDFRILTSKTVKGFADKRFIDPTGNTIIDSWLKQ